MNIPHKVTLYPCGVGPWSLLQICSHNNYDDNCDYDRNHSDVDIDGDDIIKDEEVELDR